MQMSQILHFQITNLTNWPCTTFDLHLWPLISWTCESSYIISINQFWFQLDINFSNDFTFWAHLTTWRLMDLWPWYMTFYHMNIQRVIYCINKLHLVPIGLQLFKWGHFHIFSLSYNLTSDDLWPWYVTVDLINKWGFPCCIYDLALVEIHQSMWKVEPNVNLFSQQQQTIGDKMIPIYVSFLLRQATQKLLRTSERFDCFDWNLKFRSLMWLLFKQRSNLFWKLDHSPLIASTTAPVHF